MKDIKLWKSHFFAKDFSAHADALKGINTGTTTGPELSELLSILQEADPENPWCIEPGQPELPFNLAGVEVIHNGENSKSLPTNGSFTHVLRVDFNPDELPPVGVVNFHYNV